MTAPQKKLPVQQHEFHWLSVVRILWKGKISLLAMWVVLSLIAVGVVRQVPAMYRAECLLLVAGPKIPDKYVESANTDPQDRLAAISHVILSNTGLQEIIDKFGLYQDERKVKTQDEVIKDMRENDISLKLESGLSNARPDAVRISYQARDPKVAADVANRLAGLIMDENVRSRADRAQDTSQFLEEQLSQAKTTLDQLEARVGQYKASHSGELPEQEVSLSGSLGRLQVELQGNQEALNRTEQTKIMLQNTLTVAESTLTAMEQTAKENKEREEANRKIRAAAGDPNAIPVIKPKTRRQTLQEELTSLRGRYGDDHPEIRRLKAELASLPPDTEGSGTARQPAVTSAALQELPPASGPSENILNQRERVSSLKAQLSMSSKEFESANANRTRVLRDIDVYQRRINNLPFREQELATLTRDYETAKANYKSLLDKKISAQMTTNLERNQQGEKFTLIDAARVPQEPFKPKRWILNLAGVILSLLVSGLVVVGRRLPQDIILGEWELTPGVVILGRVPRIEVRKAKLATLVPAGPIR